METLTKQDVNVSVVKNAFDDFLRGNIAGVINACTDDITWGAHDNKTVVPYARTYQGKKGVSDFFATLAGNIDYQAFDIKEISATKDKVFAKVFHKATVRSTGQSFAHDFLMEFQLRGEKVCYFFAYVDTREQAAAFSITEANKQTVRRFNKEFIEGGDINAFNQIIAPDFINHSAPPGVPVGPEGVLYFFNQFLRPAFPDMKVEIKRQVAENDLVTTHKIFHVTHKGDFMGIPATGKNITIEVIDIIRLREGKFVEHSNVLDWQNVISQLTSNN